jgi:homoserine kinase
MNPFAAPHTPSALAIRSGRAVRAFAPGGIGNVGPGLDILGCAVTGPGDAVIASLRDQPGVRIDATGHPDLPRDPSRHASAIAAAEVLRRAGRTLVGISLIVEKGLPLAGGQGGSAASALAGAAAANALLGNALSPTEVLHSALVAEERLAGRHIDNLAPALVGGMLLIRSIDPLDVIRIPTPAALRIVLLHPEMRLRTADARAVLPAHVDRATALAQAVAVATMVAAFFSDDLERLRGAIDDRIAEPARAPLLPGFLAAKSAALGAGALGCSISGGGPSSFALVNGDASGLDVLTAMLSAYAASGIAATGRIAQIDNEGTRVEEYGEYGEYGEYDEYDGPTNPTP